MGCDYFAYFKLLNGFEFQSTHPRGVRRNNRECPLFDIVISIHAPAWGATIPVPPRSRRSSNFNPRTRVGCDPRKTPARQPLHKFQSTHPRGVRLTVSLSFANASEFQSTHPRGVRRQVSARGGVFKSYFNPRTRVGCDYISKRWRRMRAISIHAPAWGATCSTK